VLVCERREGQRTGLLLKVTQPKARYGYCIKSRVLRETMSQLARWQWHTLDKESRGQWGEDYCLDWGFKSGLRDTGSSLKGLSTVAESEF
jgi:hypothetical protein